jgi:hypothetical protein
MVARGFSFLPDHCQTSFFNDDLFNFLAPVPGLQGLVDGSLNQALGKLLGLLSALRWKSSTNGGTPLRGRVLATAALAREQPTFLFGSLYYARASYGSYEILFDTTGRVT